MLLSYPVKQSQSIVISSILLALTQSGFMTLTSDSDCPGN